ncbi:D-malate degradation protein R [Cedecea davisae]|uniref:LysR substrate binding domain protein n=1 Tax=Cedecea davisae DSM 4568 TaxID=566551 RepID=S3J1V5_9ENTR|nr:LysR family transcriptional regulator [Cedecea davisae]EPF13942.1 LysR substrate binding domain protein [Cedecea davisae DSM 4568]SUX37578.1 D-malate degradation protein R [Cedecea davisae]
MALPPDVHRLIPAFLAAADCQSFSAAARQLGITPAAVSKNVRQLEQRLGIVLFGRNTHFVVLTEEGMALREQVAPLWQALNQALVNPKSEPAGLLRISVIPGFGRHRLMPLMSEFQRRYPQIRIELSMEARSVNLIGERIDIAIGHRTVRDSRVVARELYESKTIVAATPSYLERYGTPQKPEELLHHRCLVHRNPGTGRLQHWLDDDSLIDEASSWFITTSPDSLVDAALSGMGIICLADWYLDKLVEEGRLKAILKEYTPAPQQLWMKYAGGKLPPRTAVFVEYLNEKFRR